MPHHIILEETRCSDFQFIICTVGDSFCSIWTRLRLSVRCERGGWVETRLLLHLWSLSWHSLPQLGAVHELLFPFSNLCYNVGYEGQKSTLTCLSLFKYYYRILLFLFLILEPFKLHQYQSTMIHDTWYMHSPLLQFLMRQAGLSWAQARISHSLIQLSGIKWLQTLHTTTLSWGHILTSTCGYPHITMNGDHLHRCLQI